MLQQKKLIFKTFKVQVKRYIVKVKNDNTSKLPLKENSTLSIYERKETLATLFTDQQKGKKLCKYGTRYVESI